MSTVENFTNDGNIQPPPETTTERIRGLLEMLLAETTEAHTGKASLPRPPQTSFGSILPNRGETGVTSCPSRVPRQAIPDELPAPRPTPDSPALEPEQADLSTKPFHVINPALLTPHISLTSPYIGVTKL